jgi:hypothetical protein
MIDCCADQLPWHLPTTDLTFDDGDPLQKTHQPPPPNPTRHSQASLLAHLRAYADRGYILTPQDIESCWLPDAPTAPQPPPPAATAADGAASTPATAAAKQPPQPPVSRPGFTPAQLLLLQQQQLNRQPPPPAVAPAPSPNDPPARPPGRWHARGLAQLVVRVALVEALQALADLMLPAAARERFMQGAWVGGAALV